MSDPFERALAAHRAGDFQAAERAYLELPNHRNAIQNLAVLYSDYGDPGRAEVQFRRLVAARPDYAPARFGLGILLLAERRYDEGWPLFEARLDLPDTVWTPPRADFPQWTDQPLAARRIIVCAEEGAGDQMMFGRYLPRLQAAGAEVTVACPRGLAPLFEAAGFATCLFSLAQRQLPAADLWVPFGSLALRLGGGPPPPEEYLPFARGSGGGVGVVARGNPAHRNDARRSLRGVDAERLLSLGRDLGPGATGARDFGETAAAIADLDLVISVDTSVAHLAGALGKPCWVLLPRVAMDWRWNDGQRSDWYPDMRLWRQPADGDWATVLTAIEQALGEA